MPWFQRILSLNAKHSDSFLHTLDTAFDAALYFLLVLSVQVDAVALYRLWNSYLIDPPLLLLEDVIIPEKITHLTATPSVFATLVPLLESFKHQGKLTLRHASAGGETFSADLGVRLRAVGFQAIVNFYGPTETSIAATGFDVTAQIDRWRRRKTAGEGRSPNRVPISWRFSLCRRIKLWRWCQAGATGELCIAGVGLAREYLGLPDKTAATFIRDPFSPGRMYRTGDRVYRRAQGEMVFVGREDQQGEAARISD